ncbi:MAG: radical SAM protein [Spirochaetota bacterium]
MHIAHTVRINQNRWGKDVYVKSRHPVQYGLYSEIETPAAVFRFNLNREIVAMQGKGPAWPSEREWLKRTAGNDWVYYSTGGYSGTYESFNKDTLSAPIHFKVPSPYNEVYKASGEYYVPNLPYLSNSIIGIDPFRETSVSYLIEHWYDILCEYLHPAAQFSEPNKSYVEEILSQTPETLEQRAKQLFRIIGSRPTVLPPGARHVDYNLIPLSIAEGCLYKCGFCRIKNNKAFRTRSYPEITRQIEHLKLYYGEELRNYNAIFLGDHDALNADAQTIISSIKTAIETLQIKTSYMQGCSVFLFGSVDSFLGKEESFFKALEQLGCRTYINIGLESADQSTLDQIQKPIRSDQVVQSFDRLVELNDRFTHLEITANFVMGPQLPRSHYSGFLQLVRNRLDHPRSKGTIYLSPLMRAKASRSTLFEFNQLKRLSRLPIYLYTIQRL